MSQNRWTLLVVRDEADPIRQIEVSSGRIRRWAVGVGATLFGIFALAAWIGTGGIPRMDAQSARAENELLTEELVELRERIAGFEGTLEDLSERDRQMRALAGLRGIDAQILEVGIGGPGLSSPESTPLWDVDPEAASETFAASWDLSALERRASLLAQSFEAVGDSLTAHRDLLESTPSILPTSGYLSSRFSNSRLHPIHGRELPHEGVDISAPKGTPILAAAKGTVIRAGWVAGYGQMVEVDHGYGYTTRYGHASELLVRVGQQIERGAMIARVGASGIATSSHLHYEVRVNGEPRNPMNFVLDVVP
ncbi:MAG TPA: M23 family metallopeptidase [Longimicrobiales bacterium]|nr:M23 family metallopeptidase [Longimicrobiales bacterium]